MAQTTNYNVTHDLRKLAVIAVCFNPVRYKSRYDLYRQFEEHMSQSGVYLFTVECVFQSASLFGFPEQSFEVTQSNNPNHLQLVAPSVLWMKENLINIAVKHLPAYIEYVAWIDTDIEFEHLNWPHAVIDELQRYPIVQLFEMGFFLGPNGKNDILRRDYSFVYSIKHNKPIDPRRYKEWYPHPGYAWAMRRTVFNEIGGLFEFAILGSADLHLAYALLNRVRETFPKNLHEDYQRMVTQWGERIAAIAQGGHNVGYAPVNVWHHWHGNKDDRGYVERWGILERYQFSPLKDLERDPRTGIIAFVNKRHMEKLQMSVRMIALERDVIAYFLSRKEDSASNVVQPTKPVKSNPVTAKPKPTPTKPNLTAVKPKPMPVKPKPVPVKPKPSGIGSGSRFPINKPSRPTFSSYNSRPTYILLPDSSYCHTGDHDSCWIECTCGERHDHRHDPDCPCCTYYSDEHGFCSETEHHEGHHDHFHDDSNETWHEEDHHDENDYCDHGEYEGDHDEHDCHDTEGGDFDQYNALEGNDSNDYGGDDYHGDTNDYGGAGSFY